MPDLILFDDELDENCYRARLAAALLNIPVRLHAVNVVPGSEQNSPWFRALSPTGGLPALTGVTGPADSLPAICGAEAIMRTFSALTPDPAWRPGTPPLVASIAHWMDFTASSLAPAIQLRRIAMFGGKADTRTLLAASHDAFRIMEDHMILRRISGHQWFAGESVTLADIALFPTFALSRDAGIGHDPYPALRRWMRNMKTLPGFIAMPGIPDYG